MTLLANKIAEMIDELLNSQEEMLMWRGVLNTQSWKIVLYRKLTQPTEITIHAKKRDESNGEFE